MGQQRQGAGGNHGLGSPGRRAGAAAHDAAAAGGPDRRHGMAQRMQAIAAPHLCCSSCKRVSRVARSCCNRDMNCALHTHRQANGGRRAAERLRGGDEQLGCHAWLQDAPPPSTTPAPAHCARQPGDPLGGAAQPLHRCHRLVAQTQLLRRGKAIMQHSVPALAHPTTMNLACGAAALQCLPPCRTGAPPPSRATCWYVSAISSHACATRSGSPLDSACASSSLRASTASLRGAAGGRQGRRAGTFGSLCLRQRSLSMQARSRLHCSGHQPAGP